MQNSHTIPVVPKAVERAPLELWMFNHGIRSIATAARTLRVTQHVLQRALMDPESDNFRSAPVELRRKVKVWTGGAVDLNDWPERKSEDAIAEELGLPTIQGEQNVAH